MKPQTKSLSSDPLVAVKQVALNFNSKKLTISNLSKAVLCLPETRKLLAKELNLNENKLAKTMPFEVYKGAKKASEYEWPDELFESDELSFLDFDMDDEDNKNEIEKIDELVSKLVNKSKWRKWFGELNLNSVKEIRDFFKDAQAEAVGSNNILSPNISEILRIFERQCFRRLDQVKSSPMPLFIFTQDGQEELVLLRATAQQIAGTPLTIIDEAALENDFANSCLEKKSTSIALFSLNYLDKAGLEFDKLIDYLKFGHHEGSPEDLIYEDLEGKKCHLLDSHFIVIQLNCPPGFDIGQYNSIELPVQLENFVRQQRSENYEVYADTSRLQQLLHIIHPESLYIYHQPKLEDQLKYASSIVTESAEGILEKDILPFLSEQIIQQIASLALLTSIGKPLSDLQTTISELCYEWAKILPTDLSTLDGFQIIGQDQILKEALANEEKGRELIRKNHIAGKRLKVCYEFDQNTVRINIIPKGYIKVKSSGNSQYQIAPNHNTFEQVMGMEEAKMRLQMIIDYFQKPEKFHRLGVQPPMRIVLSGPPGCGKTMIAKAFSNQVGVPFYSISAAEITSQKYAGWGASLLRRVFENAKKTAPCVIFIDELDAFGNRATYGSDSVGFDARSIMNTLLVLLDGINTDERIVVLAATNRIKDLDDALLRPKRFGTIVEVAMLTLKEKADLIKNKLPESQCSGNYQQIIDYLVARTSGDVSPAKIEDIVTEVKLNALTKNSSKVSYDNLAETVDDIMLGKNTQRVSDEHKISKAYHEAAFAVLHKSFFPEIPIERISVQYRSDSFGGTYLNDQKENQTVFYTDEELIALMVTHLAAPLAEKRKLGKYSVSSSSGFAIAVKISLSLAGNIDIDKGIEHSIQYALADLNMEDTVFTSYLNRMSIKITKIAASYATEFLEKFWDTITKVAEQLIVMENLDKSTIDQLTIKIKKQAITYSDFIERYKESEPYMGFKK